MSYRLQTQGDKRELPKDTNTNIEPAKITEIQGTVGFYIGRIQMASEMLKAASHHKSAAAVAKRKAMLDQQLADIDVLISLLGKSAIYHIATE